MGMRWLLHTAPNCQQWQAVLECSGSASLQHNPSVVGGRRHPCRMPCRHPGSRATPISYLQWLRCRGRWDGALGVGRVRDDHTIRAWSGEAERDYCRSCGHTDIVISLAISTGAETLSAGRPFPGISGGATRWYASRVWCGDAGVLRSILLRIVTSRFQILASGSSNKLHTCLMTDSSTNRDCCSQR
jgi:hypothetical protein